VFHQTLFFPVETIDLSLIARDFTAIRGRRHAFRQACIFGSFILRGRVDEDRLERRFDPARRI
jgi:hypothetical protein